MMTKKEDLEDKKNSLEIAWNGFVNNLSYMNTYIDALYYEGCIEKESYKILHGRLDSLLESYRAQHIDLQRTLGIEY